MITNGDSSEDLERLFEQHIKYLDIFTVQKASRPGVVAGFAVKHLDTHLD